MEKRNLTFSIITYGCQMNEADSEMISGVLIKLGYKPVDDYKKADLVLVNTCAVRVKPETKVYGRLSALRHLKEENPFVLIGMCGCVAQKERHKIIEKAPFVDLVFGPQSIGELPQLLMEAQKSVEYKKKMFAKLKDGQKLKSRYRGASVMGNFESIGENMPEDDIFRPSKFKAYITVMRGCNNFCSYCVVPYTRGRERSRPFETILSEVRQLVESGYKEITLLGQNVNSYNDGSNRAFPDLMAEIDKIPGHFYVRFMTSHPKDLSDKLIDVIAGSKHLAPHIHLPFQAGSTKVLALMNRRYTREHYLGLIEKIKAKIPGAALTTDVIAGFPQETEDDFNETVSLLEKVRFDSAFLFFYSEREGTKALELEGSVPVDTRLARLDKLISLQMQITSEVNAAKVGEEHEGIVEGRSPRNKNEYSVRTFDNHVVVVKKPEDAGDEFIGEFVRLKITKGYNFVLRGDLLERSIP